jgi:hypothetical protein
MLEEQCHTVSYHRIFSTRTAKNMLPSSGSENFTRRDPRDNFQKLKATNVMLKARKLAPGTYPINGTGTW